MHRKEQRATHEAANVQGSELWVSTQEPQPTALRHTQSGKEQRKDLHMQRCTQHSEQVYFFDMFCFMSTER